MMDDQFEDDNDTSTSGSSKPTTSDIFSKLQKLYTDQLGNIDDSNDGLKVKVEILESWVQDLTDHNVMLIKTVDELEGEALKRLGMLEQNLNKKDSLENSQKLQEPTLSTHSSKDCHTSKGLSQIECLCQELEEVKLQLCEKERLVSKYKHRLEELNNVVKEDKLNLSNKNDAHRLPPTTTDLCMLDSHDSSLLHEELESTRIQLCQTEKEVSFSKKKLKEAEANVKRLRCDLVTSEKNAKEMRAALSAEVAEKHDQVLALRKEVIQLEDQLRQADMQTHFKDDIIKELRKEVKVARSKETLVEVLGIKERSLSHLEHLTQQLEEKEMKISCLKAQLQQAPDMLYRVRQQVDWFTENISQQCATNNIPEEFKKCITTMLEELRESIECCNIGPPNTSEQHKESIVFLSAILDSLDVSQKELCKSWSTIWETSHQINKIDPSVCIENWKNCLCKQYELQRKIQLLVHSIIQTLSNTQAHTGCVIEEIGSLFCLISSVRDELNVQPQSKNYAVWLKRLHRLVSQSILKMQEISELSSKLKHDEESVLVKLDENMNTLSILSEELGNVIQTEQHVYEKLHKLEKAQKVKVDTLLASVFHHNDIWDQQVALDGDVKKELQNLINNYRYFENQPTVGKRRKQPMDRHDSDSFQVITLVSQMSSEIQTSISDIEQRQNQVSHLEIDLCSVRVFLESAQCEIDNISKNCKSRDVTEKVRCLLTKLNKEISNVLKKADSLVDVYKATKQDYIASFQRVVKLQKAFDCVEKELNQYYSYTKENCDESVMPSRCEKNICAAQTELKKYKAKCVDNKDNLQKCCNFSDKYEEMQKAVAEKERELQNVTDKMMKLKSNIQERDKLAANQEETICVLQSSLKMCQKEAEESQKIIASLEARKDEIEKDCKKQIQQFQNKIAEMKNSLKQSEEIVKKHQKSEAALQIVMENLKENMSKDLTTICKLQQENGQLLERLARATNAHKIELETLTTKDSLTMQENEQTIGELKKQVKFCSAKVTDIEKKLKTVNDQLLEASCRERELQSQLSIKETQHQEEMCEKQLEVTKLTSVVKTMTDKLKDASSDLESERMKTCEAEQKLRKVCAACEDLKMKLKDSESTTEKLQAALTQLSNKFVSSRLDKGSLRQYQEQCAKFETLYNATSCRLLSKESEMDSMMRELERLRAELNCRSVASIHQRDEEEDCPFLFGRVQQLSKELQLAQSCHSNYESVLKEVTEKYSKKEEEVSKLKVQLKQITKERDSLLMDLEVAHEQIAKLKVDNSELERALHRVETSKEQITDQMKNVQRMLCDSQGTGKQELRMQPNIELQREISTALSSQLRSTKQKLHNLRHDYKSLQTAYEELNGKLSLLQRGERESEHNWDVPHQICTPCTGTKSSKSLAHVRYSQEYMKDKAAYKYTSHSKSWHKLGTDREMEEKEKCWKQKLQQVIRGDDSSSS